MHSCDRQVSERRIEAKEMRRDRVLECDQSNATANGRKHSLRATDIALTLHAYTAAGSQQGERISNFIACAHERDAH